jgi:hypothetical protein
MYVACIEWRFVWFVEPTSHALRSCYHNAKAYDNTCEGSLTMAREVCRNVMENWWRVKKTFSACEVGSTVCVLCEVDWKVPDDVAVATTTQLLSAATPFVVYYFLSLYFYTEGIDMSFITLFTQKNVAIACFECDYVASYSWFRAS